MTFVQFVFVAVIGLPSQFDPKRPPFFLKPNRVPIRRWLVNIVLFFSINVLPEFHAWGLGLALFRNIMQDGLALGMQHAELSWVLESSQLSRGSLERGGAEHTKTWRIYEAEL